jgi:tetratricopeptide (TPR) repeat protein
VALVAIARGFAFIHLGDKNRAIAEFTRAITANPTMAEPYSARGLETYPSDTSIQDLERSLALGMAYHLPAYYLAHFYMRNESWSRATEFAKLALRFEPPDAVRANLLEWLAIANIQLGGDVEVTRRQFLEALRISPESLHIRKNLEVFEESIRLNQVRPKLWRVERDAAGGAKEISELAA